MAQHTENIIQPPPNSTGQPIRLLQITRPDGTVVNMEAVSVVDADDPTATQKINALGETKVSDPTTRELLFLILLELQQLNASIGGAPASAAA